MNRYYSLIWTVFFLGCAHTDTPKHAHQHEPASAHKSHSHRHGFDDAEKWAKRFEDPKRDSWQKPDEVIAALQLHGDERIADIGAATGYFTARLAKLCARVWGIDIEPNMVRYLNSRARREGLDNVFAVLGLPEDPMLPEPVDLVLIVNTYHHIDDRVGYFGRLKSWLRDGARLVIVDFLPGELPLGPPPDAKLSAEQVLTELREAGYRGAPVEIALPYQYMVVVQGD